MKRTSKLSWYSLLMPVLFYLLPINSYCKIKATDYSAVFDVIVNDPNLLHHTKLIFEVQQKGVNTSYKGYSEAFTLTLNKQKSTIRLALSTKYNYLKIIQLKDDRPENNRVFDEGNGLFIVKDGDRVQLHLSTDKSNVFFQGKGAAKYNCQFQIGNQNAYSVSKFNFLISQDAYKKAFEEIKFQHDSIFAIQQNLLKHYRHQIPSTIYQLINLDWYAYKSQRIAEAFYIPFTSNKYSLYSSAKELFNENFNSYKGNEGNDLIEATQSYRYADYLLAREKISIIINKSDSSNNYRRKVSFANIDSAINKLHVKGQLKDKLVLISFLAFDRITQPDYIKYLDAEVNALNEGIYKAELVNFQNKNIAGAKSFEFKLKDTSGKVHTLSEYRGKLVVVDFWFTGCQACLLMAPVLKSISSSYANNSNIVFLSVSIDQNDKAWKQSVAKELYCGPDEINVRAEIGKDSKIIKFYNIDAYPSLIIISKDGKLVTAAPPDPRHDYEGFNKLLMTNL